MKKLKEQKSKEVIKGQWNQNKICKGRMCFDILCISSKDLLEAKAKAKPESWRSLRQVPYLLGWELIPRLKKYGMKVREELEFTYLSTESSHNGTHITSDTREEQEDWDGATRYYIGRHLDVRMDERHYWQGKEFYKVLQMRIFERHK